LDSVHNNPFRIIDWLKDKHSIESHLRIVAQQEIKKYTVEDMENIIKGLTK